MISQNKIFTFTNLFLVGMLSLTLSVSSCNKKTDDAATNADMVADSAKKVADEAAAMAKDASAVADEANAKADEALAKLPEKAKTFISEYETIGKDLKEMAEKIKNKDTDPTLATKFANKMMEATKKHGQLMLESKMFGLTPEQKTTFDAKIDEIKAMISSAEEAKGK